MRTKLYAYEVSNYSSRSRYDASNTNLYLNDGDEYIVNALGEFQGEWSYIEDYSKAGADIITFHPEATTDVSKTIKLIKDQNKKVGISLKPKSEINLIKEYLNQIDLVLIMSVEPGFGGQKFMPEVLKKTKIIRDLINQKNLKVDIEIDGGINFENCSKAKDAGANILVSGSTVFKENKGDLKKNIEILRNN